MDGQIFSQNSKVDRNRDRGKRGEVELSLREKELLVIPLRTIFMMNLWRNTLLVWMLCLMEIYF